jgi:hypothetical protein
LTDYASEVEQMVETKAWQMDALDAELSAVRPGLGRTQVYWEGRVAAGVELVEKLQVLQPPEQVAELHAATLGIMSRYVAAEEAYAARAGIVETMSELELSAEAQAVRVVEDDIRAICRQAQTTFDETNKREVLSGVPWIPTELKEVIHVAFRCSAEEKP